MKSEPPMLKRLGPVPFWRGEERCLDALRRMYERAMEAAAKPRPAPPPGDRAAGMRRQ